MKQLEFEWDKKKDKTNIKKHGVSFDDAPIIGVRVKLKPINNLKILQNMGGCL